MASRRFIQRISIYYAIMYKAKTIVVEYICEHTGINRVCDWRDEKDQTVVHIATKFDLCKVKNVLCHT